MGERPTAERRAPSIETPRLVLTWPTDEQIRGYYDAIVGTTMFDTILWDGPSSPDELCDGWAARRAKDPTDLDLPLDLAVIERSTSRYVGGVSLRPEDPPFVIDVGYAFAPRAHGRGYATEAVGALVDHAFEARRAERIEAAIFVGNEASRHVVQKLGFHFEGTLRHVAPKRGAWRDEWLLAITRPDWERRGSRTTR
ncbi:MAG: GNAT family N-acetyltransferase [Sandaracinaceae bacterium]